MQPQPTSPTQKICKTTKTSNKQNKSKTKCLCMCEDTVSDRAKPTENQKRRGSGGGRGAVPFLAISISSSVQRDVSPASTAPVATHTVRVSEGELRQRYTTRLISHPPSLSVYTWGLQRPPPPSRTSLPRALSLCPQQLSVLCSVYCFPFLVLAGLNQAVSPLSNSCLSLSFSLSLGECSQLISSRQWRSAEAPPFWV